MKAVFEANPNASELICFEDGVCFLSNAQGKCGAIDYEKRTGLKPKVVQKEVNEEKQTNKKQNQK
jgi:hypothetical protein